MAVDVKDVNGYKLKATLRQELYLLMQKYEVPNDVAEFSISSFITVIIDDIEKSYNTLNSCGSFDLKI